MNAKYLESLKSQLSYPVNTRPNLVHLRDGLVVLYKRNHSQVWQMRYQLYDKQWRRISTGHRDLDFAIRTAGDIYDKARFRERLGLAQTTKKFSAVAKLCVKELQNEISADIKPHTNSYYIRTIDKHLTPFFGYYNPNRINGAVMKKY